MKEGGRNGFRETILAEGGSSRKSHERRSFRLEVNLRASGAHVEFSSMALPFSMLPKKVKRKDHNAHFIVDEDDVRPPQHLADFGALAKVGLADVHRPARQPPQFEPRFGFDDVGPRELRRVRHVFKTPRFGAGPVMVVVVVVVVVVVGRCRGFCGLRRGILPERKGNCVA